MPEACLRTLEVPVAIPLRMKTTRKILAIMAALGMTTAAWAQSGAGTGTSGGTSGSTSGQTGTTGNSSGTSGQTNGGGDSTGTATGTQGGGQTGTSGTSGDTGTGTSTGTENSGRTTNGSTGARVNENTGTGRADDASTRNQRTGNGVTGMNPDQGVNRSDRTSPATGLDTDPHSGARRDHSVTDDSVDRAIQNNDDARRRMNEAQREAERNAAD